MIWHDLYRVFIACMISKGFLFWSYVPSLKSWGNKISFFFYNLALECLEYPLFKGVVEKSRKSYDFFKVFKIQEKDFVTSRFQELWFILTRDLLESIAINNNVTLLIGQSVAKSFCKHFISLNIPLKFTLCKQTKMIRYYVISKPFYWAWLQNHSFINFQKLRIASPNMMIYSLLDLKF